MARMICFLVVLLFITVVIYCHTPNFKVRKIDFNDLEVGDILSIKGETFRVNSYDENRNISLSKYKATGIACGIGNPFTMQFPENLTYELHMKDNKRLYVDVIGFTRTVTNSFEKMEIVEN